MPELTIHRCHPERTPVRPVCMYCGGPAEHEDVRPVEHPRGDRPAEGGGGGDLTSLPTGDDPVSAVIAVLMLPFILWDLLVAFVALLAGLVGLAGWVRRRVADGAARPEPAKPRKSAPVTAVTITTCGSHRNFRRRFVVAGVVMLVGVVGLWVWAIAALAGDWPSAAGVTLAALFAALCGPLGLAFWYTLAGPVIVDRVTRDTVVLDRVRAAYFEATGTTDRPAEAA